MYDETMSKSVYEILSNFFTKPKGTKDVQMLAAERMSALLLDDAWRELEKFKQEEKKPKSTTNPGL